MYVELCPIYIHQLELKGPSSFLHLQSVKPSRAKPVDGGEGPSPRENFHSRPSQATLFQVATIGSAFVFVQACEGNSFSNSAAFQAKGHLNFKGQMQASCVYLFLGTNTGLCANIHVL